MPVCLRGFYCLLALLRMCSGEFWNYDIVEFALLRIEMTTRSSGKDIQQELGLKSLIQGRPRPTLTAGIRATCRVIGANQLDPMQRCQVPSCVMEPSGP